MWIDKTGDGQEVVEKGSSLFNLPPGRTYKKKNRNLKKKKQNSIISRIRISYLSIMDANPRPIENLFFVRPS